MQNLLVYQRNCFHALLVLVIALASIPTSASMPTWLGVEIRHFEQSKSNPQIVIAVGQGVLYRSQDGGKSWLPLRVPVNERLTIEWADIDALDHRRLIVLAWDQSSSRQHQFYESRDEGKTWTSTTPVTMEFSKRVPASSVVPRSLRHGSTQTHSNQSFDKQLIDTGYSIATNVIQLAGKSFFLDGKTLWVSESEDGWVVRHQFPDADAENKRFVYSNLLALSNSVLVVRQPNGTWLQSKDEGFSWAESNNNLDKLNTRLVQASLGTSPTPNGDTRCRVQVSPANQLVLVATCVWDNGSLPSRACVHHSADGGANWSPPPKSTSYGIGACADVGLPTGWAPTSLLMDRSDPRKMLIGWMAGGVYRSEDGGQHWTPSDEGLRFREKHGGRFDFIAIAEPLIIRAVLFRDLAQLDQLVAQGASINEPGNKLSGVLDAELTVLEDRRSDHQVASLWPELRKRGVSANAPEGRRSNLLKRALSLSAPEIVDDLISDGYDWATPEHNCNNCAPASTEIGSLISSDDPRTRLALESILKKYIQANKFPAADVTIRELLMNNHRSSAVQILRAATAKNVLDKQSTPVRVDRLELAALLLQAGESKLAKQFFLAAKKEHRLSFNDEYWRLVQAIDVTCNPKEAAWYAAQGIRSVSLVDCLDEFEYPSKSARMNVLNYMVKTRSIDAEDWNSFLEKSSHSWVRDTKHHRLFESELKFLPYAVVGVEVDGLDADTPFRGAARYPKISGLLTGFPAQRQGVRVGDEITRVNGRSTVGMQFYEVRKLLIGRAGTTVQVQIRRGDEAMHFNLLREPVNQQ